MPPPRHPSEAVLAALRARIAAIGQGSRKPGQILPFGVAAMDAHLPFGGLPQGALHEVTGGGLAASHGAAASLFVAGVLARVEGPVLWCLRARDLFAPALAGAGLHPDRVIYAEAGDAATLLLCLEQGLRHGGLAGVVGETSRLAMAPSRRLHLAAETSGVMAFVIRRGKAAGDGEPNAATTRWRITAAPSSPLPVPGVGRARWLIELRRCRGGEPAAWEMEACDAQGYLAVPAGAASRKRASA
jgi:protein ImuA